MLERVLPALTTNKSKIAAYDARLAVTNEEFILSLFRSGIIGRLDGTSRCFQGLRANSPWLTVRSAYNSTLGGLSARDCMLTELRFAIRLRHRLRCFAGPRATAILIGVCGLWAPSVLRFRLRDGLPNIQRSVQDASRMKIPRLMRYGFLLFALAHMRIRCVVIGTQDDTDPSLRKAP